MKNLTLTMKILLGLVLGIILGIIINQYLSSSIVIDDYLVNGVFYIIGQMFLNAIKMLVVPLVFVSITLGTAKMGDIKKVDQISGKHYCFI